MSVHIKSAELCDRCVYTFYRHCSDEILGDCVRCVMYDTGKPGGCKCLTIKPNTPCPYFEQVKVDASD